MGRKRKGDPVHGWLVLDKPQGLTSTTALGKVKRLMNAQKAGHGGTLDPLATGLLPLAFGEATKTVSYIMDGDKTYRFTVAFGAATDTDDAEGEVIERSDVRPTDDEIIAALPSFIGEIDQIPPQYSAIKVQGERAYNLARDNETVELAARTIWVERFELIERPDDDHAIFEVDCGKGTYVRSLARDLSRKLSTVGHVQTLRRTAVGPFTEEDAISLAELEALGHSAPARECLLPVETALDDIPALAVTDMEASRLRCGQTVSLLSRADRDRTMALLEAGTEPGDVVFVLSEGRPVALAVMDHGEIRPVRVLNM
ncbi:MAG: tRNA pseudouridine(55) synthase TruB [Pseudomonadota bacterium]